MKIQEETVHTYAPVIYKIAYNYFGNKEDAEDIMQEVIIKILTCKREFDSEEHIKNWVVRCSVNECHSLFRTPFRRKRAAFDDNNKENEDDDVYIGWEEDDDAQLVREALIKLPAKYRIVIYLYYYEEYKAKEIAQLLGRRESTVQTWLARGRKQMEAVLREGGING